MLRFILISIFAAFTVSVSFANSISLQQLQIISDCSDDPARLEEGRLMADSLLAAEGIKRDPLYAQLLYLQCHNYLNSGLLAQCKELLLTMLGELDRGTYVGQELAEPNDLPVCLPNDLGLLCRREALNDSALYYYERALSAARQHDDKEWQAALCLNIGILHFNLGHAAEAEQMLDHGYVLLKEADDPYTEMCLLQVRAGVKLRMDKVDEARQSIEAAYSLALESEMPDWQLRCLSTMLSIYERDDAPSEAAKAVERGNELLPLLPPQSIAVTGYLTARGNYYMSCSRWQMAADDFTAVLSSQMGGVKTGEFFSHLAQCYAELHQWDQAYRYKDSAAVYVARETEEQFSAQLADFNVRYHTMEKDLQISRLETQRQRFFVITVAAAVIVLLLFVGLWLWLRVRRQRREAKLHISTLEQERTRIARELHDGLCNDLLALEMQCASGFPPDETAARLSMLRQQARSLSHQLLPPAFDHLSLQKLLSLFTQQLHDDTAIDVSFSDTTAANTSFTPATAFELYRIVQEHTASIIKGGTATHIGITLSDRRLCIVDNGNATAANGAQGVGHRTISDRALNIGATLDTTPDSTLNESEPLNFLNIILP